MGVIMSVTMREFFIIGSSKDEIDLLIDLNFGANNYPFNLCTEHSYDSEEFLEETNFEPLAIRVVGFSIKNILHDKNNGTWLIKDRINGTPVGGITCLHYPKGFQITFIHNRDDYQENVDQFIKEFVRKGKLLGYSIEEVNKEGERSENEHPWDKIPEKNWDREAVRLWWEGLSGKEIALIVGCSKERVHNRLCELRKIHDENIVPTDKMRRRIHLSR